MRIPLLLLPTLIAAALAAQPDWSVNPSEFQYTMTMAGVALFECEESMDENDLVAAFINGEVRGVQHFNTTFQGRQYAYLIVFDNVLQGNEISFRLYDASEGVIHDVRNTVFFEENGNEGSLADPFHFNTHYGIEALFLTKDTIPGNALAGEVVAEIFSVNEAGDTVVLEYSFVDGQLGPDNAYFSIDGHQLVLAQDVDIDAKTEYRVHLLGMDSLGCTLDIAFALTVPNGGVMGLFGRNTSGVGIHLFPNPTKGTLHFQSDEKYGQLLLYDLTGRLLHETPIGPNQTSVDLSHLSGRSCWAVFRSERSAHVKMVVVE